jgi:cobalt-zinc-cadmium efflux system membrane fusion protein
VDYENQLITARSNLDVARKNLQVTEDLFKGNLATEKDYITAQNEVRKAESEFGKIKKILSIYGEESESSIYSVKAPISGFIVEKNVTENMQFRSDNTENLFTISNLDNLWAIANVYETDISKVYLNQEAIVTTIAYPKIEFKGHVDKIFNVLDPDNRVEKIKIKLENHENLLKPEMFAYAVIKCPENKEFISVMSQAIIFNNSKNYVLVYKDKCSVEVREVTIYKSVKGHTFITSGLKDGETIISNNQLLIYNSLNN